MLLIWLSILVVTLLKLKEIGTFRTEILIEKWCVRCVDNLIFTEWNLWMCVKTKIENKNAKKSSTNVGWDWLWLRPKKIIDPFYVLGQEVFTVCVYNHVATRYWDLVFVSTNWKMIEIHVDQLVDATALVHVNTTKFGEIEFNYCVLFILKYVTARQLVLSFIFSSSLIQISTHLYSLS